MNKTIRLLFELSYSIDMLKEGSGAIHRPVAEASSRTTLPFFDFVNDIISCHDPSKHGM